MSKPSGFNYRIGQKQHRLVDLVRILKKRGDELFIFGESDKKPRPPAPDELGLPIDSRDRFITRCKNGHFRETRVEHLINYGCRECVEGVLKYSIDDLRLAAHRNNGECLSTEYLGFEKKHSWRCADGHRFETTPHSIMGVKKTWCPKCARIKNGENRRSNRAPKTT